MTPPLRTLTAPDIMALQALQAESPGAAAAFDGAARLATGICGSLRLITVLRYRAMQPLVERIYSSDPAYAVGGTKPLADFPLNHAAMARGDIFLAATKAEVRAAFADHDRLFAMGITAILNAPIRHAGRRLATLNLCGAEGQFEPPQIASVRTIATALAPTLLGHFGTG